MPDSSPNALGGTVISAPRPERQEVYREPIELFRLEEMLSHTKNSEERYQIYSLILTRELAQALNIVEPARSDPRYDDYAKDMDKLGQIREAFLVRQVPMPDFPGMVPRTGKANAEYEVNIDRSRTVFVLAEHLTGFLQVLMTNRLQVAYAQALLPFPGWHLDIRQMLSKYHVWDMDSEVSAMLSSTSDAEINKEYAAGRAHVDRLRRTGSEDGPDVVDDAPMDDDTENGEATADASGETNPFG